MSDWSPSLILFYADTREPLTFEERMALHYSAIVVSATPREILLENPNTGRKIVVAAVGAPATPQPPSPRGT